MFSYLALEIKNSLFWSIRPEKKSKMLFSSYFSVFFLISMIGNLNASTMTTNLFKMAVVEESTVKQNPPVVSAR